MELRHLFFKGRGGARGSMTLKFELGRDFTTVHLPTKFHHPTFNRAQVIVLTYLRTNKHIRSKTATSLRYRCQKYPLIQRYFVAMSFPYFHGTDSVGLYA